MACGIQFRRTVTKIDHTRLQHTNMASIECSDACIMASALCLGTTAYMYLNMYVCTHIHMFYQCGVHLFTFFILGKRLPWALATAGPELW